MTRAQAIGQAALDQAAIERREAIKAIAQAVDLLDDCGATHLGHLRYGQALRFHRATEKLIDLVRELEAGQ